MVIDDTIVRAYLAGADPAEYAGSWVFSALGRGDVFAPPDPAHRAWVAQLSRKLQAQISAFAVRNEGHVRALFPEFGRLAAEFTVMLAVGFPDPYDAMMLTAQDGRPRVVFDLIRFGQAALREGYSCHGVLTHELLHIALHERFPEPEAAAYEERLDYIVFDEGFAHALSYREGLAGFTMDDQLRARYASARAALARALAESDPARQEACLERADTSPDFWAKFGSISGMCYVLAHEAQMPALLKAGYRGFARKVLADG